MINHEFEKLGLRSEEIKAFVFIIENPGQPVGVIAKKTGVSRPSLYGYLKNLQEKLLVTQSIKDGVKIFSPASQEAIEMSIDDKIKDLEKTKDNLRKVFLEIQKGTKSHPGPRLRLFEGIREVPFSPKDILLYRDIEVKSYWPIKLMLEVLGEDFFREFNKERIRRNISIKAIWPEKSMVDIKKYPYLGVGKEFKREIRLAPKEIDFSMGYWIYEDKVLFVSSKKESFSFILECREFAEMLASQFDTVWKISKTISISTKETEEFISEI